MRLYRPLSKPTIQFIAVGELAPLFTQTYSTRVALPSEWFNSRGFAFVLKPISAMCLPMAARRNCHQLAQSHRFGTIFCFNQQPNYPEKMAIWLTHLPFLRLRQQRRPKTTTVPWAENPWQLQAISANARAACWHAAIIGNWPRPALAFLCRPRSKRTKMA